MLKQHPPGEKPKLTASSLKDAPAEKFALYPARSGAKAKARNHPDAILFRMVPDGLRALGPGQSYSAIFLR